MLETFFKQLGDMYQKDANNGANEPQISYEIIEGELQQVKNKLLELSQETIDKKKQSKKQKNTLEAAVYVGQEQGLRLALLELTCFMSNIAFKQLQKRIIDENK